MGIYGFSRGFSLSRENNPALRNPDIPDLRGRAGAVDDRCAAKQEIDHFLRYASTLASR